MHEIRFSPQAEKCFKKIKDKQLKRVFEETLQIIAEDPYAGDEKRGDLAGFYGWDVYHARTNYEIAYRIREEGGRLVIIVLAGTRENLYEQLKRYIKTK